MLKTKTIYGLVDPTTKLIRYVGCSEDVERRLAEHIYARSNSTKPLADWINSLVEEDLFPTCQILEVVNVDFCRKAETRWTKHYKASGQADLNTLREYSKSLAVEAMSSSHKLKMSEGRKKSKAWKKAVSRPRTAFEKQLMSEAQLAWRRKAKSELTVGDDVLSSTESIGERKV